MAAKFAPSESVLDEVLLRVMKKCNIEQLSRQQSTALKSFVSDLDTFVSLPTGHGKSLIYQLAIPFAKELLSSEVEIPRSLPSRPTLLVVAPLTALVEEQVLSCAKFALKACKLEDFHDRCDPDVLFTSPETLEKYYGVISTISDRIIGVVVDETHCVVTW